MLNDTLERSRTIDWIVAFFTDVFFGGLGECQAKSLLRESLTDSSELEFNNRGDFIAIEAVENNNLVDSVKKLRTEMSTQSFDDLSFSKYRTAPDDH